MPSRIGRHLPFQNETAMQPVDGGQKGDHFGSLKGASDAVEVWRVRGRGWPGATAILVFSGWLIPIFGAVGAIGPTFDLEDDCFLHQAIKQSHGQGAVGQVIAPFIEVDVGHQRG